MRDSRDEMSSAKEAYNTLMVETLREIQRIDDRTPWQEVEPKWWLDMMETKRLIQQKQ